MMDQTPGQAAIVAYTQLNELRQHYTEAVRQEWAPLLERINRRLAN